jgi:hypothetical protein
VPTKNKVELLQEPPIEKPKKPTVEQQNRSDCQKFPGSDGGDHELAVDLFVVSFPKGKRALEIPDGHRFGGMVKREHAEDPLEAPRKWKVANSSGASLAWLRGPKKRPSFVKGSGVQRPPSEASF